MNQVLLDTNAYSQLMTGNAQVLAILANAERVFFSVFVMGELIAGFKGGRREAENRRVLKRFLSKSSVQILMATPETAEIFGWLKNKLRQAGTPIPINDLWIAAHAVETGSVLIASDSHFTSVPGLRLLNPVNPSE